MGRRSHGGLVALIICLAVLGYMVSRTSHGLHGMHVFGHGVDEDDFFSHLLGQEHDADRNLNQQIPAGASVDIQVPHGDVTVTPSGDDQIHVQAHQVVYAANDRYARRNLDALAPQLMVNGKNVTLRAADASDGRADLTIEIPNGAVPTVTAGHGDVTIEGLAGHANVNADRGDVKVDNLAGGLHVRMGKGDFSAHAIAGDLSLQGRLDDVSISDVQGRVALDGDFFGDTNLAHIAAPVHFHSSRTDVEVASIPGDLSIDSGDLQLNNATGPAQNFHQRQGCRVHRDYRRPAGGGWRWGHLGGRGRAAGGAADSQPQWRHPPDRAPGRRLSAAGDGQERQHRFQAGPAGHQRRRGPEHYRQGGRGRSHGSSWSPITATSRSPPWTAACSAEPPAAARAPCAARAREQNRCATCVPRRTLTAARSR